jgi:hypothetical protein
MTSNTLENLTRRALARDASQSSLYFDGRWFTCLHEDRQARRARTVRGRGRQLTIGVATSERRAISGP